MKPWIKIPLIIYGLIWVAIILGLVADDLFPGSDLDWGAGFVFVPWLFLNLPVLGLMILSAWAVRKIHSHPTKRKWFALALGLILGLITPFVIFKIIDLMPGVLGVSFREYGLYGIAGTGVLAILSLFGLLINSTKNFAKSYVGGALFVSVILAALYLSGFETYF